MFRAALAQAMHSLFNADCRRVCKSKGVDHLTFEGWGEGGVEDLRKKTSCKVFTVEKIMHNEWL